MSRKSLIADISSDEFCRIVMECRSRQEILRRLGYKSGASSYPFLDERLRREDLYEYIEEQKRKMQKDFCNLNRKKSAPLDEILVKSKHRLHAGHRRVILKSNILGYCCSMCGIGKEYNNLPLVLQIDHINGDPRDHRAGNIRLLCPNCHSQTHTYGRKNREPRKKKPDILKTEATGNKCELCKKNISRKAVLCKSCAIRKRNNGGKRPEKEKLRMDLLSMCWEEVGRKYEVSGNSVRKWSKFYGFVIEDTNKRHKKIS